MKYIPVDKLTAEIDKKWKELADKNVKVGGGKWDAEISTYLSVLRIIDSLQQEMPEVALIYKPNMTISEMVDSINGKQPEVDEQEYGPYARQYPKSQVNQKNSTRKEE